MYLLTIRWANRPGPGNPLAMGIAGLGAAITTAGGDEVAAAAGSGSLGSGLAENGPGSRLSAPAPAGVPFPAAALARTPEPDPLAAPGIAAVGLQQGQTYLWTKCSMTNNDAGR